ncbi:N-acyl-D-amino-acid deacylase family protein [Lacimicrobium alkaliphilum]|uniref:Dihydroorotase n=1 Tax=Lacimicrobium alkaliphilum TaxID=1526571 RepID=A0ABQ1R2J4_9ALTE|nr:amidohydrolase family protein [Lacimicrobium alkaliphilum]GGD54105.1 dihydroorotase [Lacimicrobium alkaliphilum]
MLFLRLRVLVLLVLGLAFASAPFAKKVDWVIQSTQIHPGGQQAPFSGVVVIDEGRILLMAEALPEDIRPDKVIDASDKLVAPGFIDPHTHACRDFDGTEGNLNANYLTQGVTTVFCNNDGGGPSDIGAQMQQYQNQGIGTNVALHIGHNSIRRQVMGQANRPASAEELSQMQDLVTGAMQDGAMGLSTGLYYVPGSYAELDEVIALAKVAARFGGHYDSHIRDESSYNIGLLASVEEVIAVADKADIAANIAHIKALGVDVWGHSTKVIELVEQARERGLKITADQYPWLASGSSISASLMPAWAKAGGHEALLQRLQDNEQQKRIKTEIKDNLRRRGGADSLLITDPSTPEYRGKTLAQVAKQHRLSAVDMAIEIIRQGNASVASFNMQDEDLQRFMRQDWVMTSSDGSTGHPRKYASFPRKYAGYVKDKGVLSTGAYIHRSSTLAARTFNLHKRGELKPGYIADLVIFDPQSFTPQASYLEPQRHSSGVEWLLINGEAAIADGKVTGIKAGKVLKRE